MRDSCIKFCIKNPLLAHRAGVRGEVKGQMRADHLEKWSYFGSTVETFFPQKMVLPYQRWSCLENSATPLKVHMVLFWFHFGSTLERGMFQYLKGNPPVDMEMTPLRSRFGSTYCMYWFQCSLVHFNGSKFKASIETVEQTNNGLILAASFIVPTL